MDGFFDYNLNIDMRDTLEKYHNKKDVLLLEDIYILKNIFDEHNIQNIYTNEYKINRLAHKFERIDMKYKKVVLNDILNNKDKHLSFANLKDKITITGNSNKDYKLVKMQESIDLAEQFMSDYNSNLLDTFNNLKNNHRIKIITNNMLDVGGYIYSLNYSTPYMIINEKKNIYDGSCLVHETAHVYNNKLSILKKPKYPNYCQEVYSNYTQMLFCKYLEDNNMYTEDIKRIKINKLISLKIHLNRIKYGLENNNRIFMCENDYQYAYGIALAIYYYNKYLEDPELTEYYMDWFIKCSNYFNLDDNLKRFAINKEKIITKKMINNYLK